jgi:hypothetical protein
MGGGADWILGVVVQVSKGGELSPFLLIGVVDRIGSRVWSAQSRQYRRP